MALYQTGSKLGVDFNNTSTSALFTLLDRANGANDSLWVYVLANGAITKGDCVVIASSGTASRATVTTPVTTQNSQLGFAQATFADLDYGWVARNGIGLTVRVSGTVTGGGIAALYIAATSGVLSTTASSATIVGVQIADTSSTAVAVAITGSISWPRCNAPGA